MSRPRIVKCLGCGCSDEKRCAGGCTFTLRDVFSQLGVCTRCDTAENRERFATERKKARATCATQEVA